MAAANFAAQSAESERAPHNSADALIQGQRHEFPFIFATKEGIVGLVGDVAGEAEFF